MIFLDMDGCIADIGQAVSKIFDVKITPESEALYGNTLYQLMGMATKQDVWNVINDVPDFWENIPPYPWYEELVDALQHIDEVQILTSSPRTDALTKSNAGTGKARWIGKYLLNKNLRVNIVHDKYLLSAPGRILIDDRTKHCDVFTEHGGRSILFDQPWNDGTYDADDIIYHANTYHSLGYIFDKD